MNYSKEFLKRKLQVQTVQQWDMENDISWELGIDLTKSLLPPVKSPSIIPDGTPEEEHAFSQFMGLIAAAAIAEHEKLIEEIKEYSFDGTLKKYNVSDEFVELGESFFKDEAKHSKAFTKYIDLYAKELNLTPDELKSILPAHHKNSIFCNLFKLNSYLGGMAFWWTVATTEEHSMEIFRIIRPMQKKVDPLYYQIHKLHFEEEVRHSSFAQMMLDLQRSKEAPFLSRVLRKCDFVFSDLLEKAWTIIQLKKLSRVHRFKNRHPLLNTISVVITKINSIPLHKRINLLRGDIDYLSLMINPRKHKNIQNQISKSNAFVLRILEGSK